jgi:hypothetical protein
MGVCDLEDTFGKREMGFMVWVYNTMILLGFQKNEINYNKTHSYMPNDFTRF